MPYEHRRRRNPRKRGRKGEKKDEGKETEGAEQETRHVGERSTTQLAPWLPFGFAGRLTPAPQKSKRRLTSHGNVIKHFNSERRRRAEPKEKKRPRTKNQERRQEQARKSDTSLAALLPVPIRHQRLTSLRTAPRLPKTLASRECKPPSCAAISYSSLLLKPKWLSELDKT